MKQKIITCLSLMMLLCSGAWADGVAAENVRGTVYAGSTTGTPDQSLSQFEETLATYPNAVMIVNSDCAEAVNAKTGAEYTYKNVIVKYKIGTSTNCYYECPNFVLTDRESSLDEANMGFYSPVSFIAVSGSYSRSSSNAKQIHSSACLPFALSKSDLTYTGSTAGQTNSILTYAYYEPIYSESGENTGDANAYFNRRDVVDAGTPILIEYAFSLSKTFNNTEIIGTPDNSNSMQGTFVATDDYKQDGYWGLDDIGKYLVHASATLNPFRSITSLTYDVNFSDTSKSSSSAFINIGIIEEDGSLTGIDGTPISTEASQNATKAIYTIDGKKVNEATLPGLYIINGKKVMVK